MSSYPLSRPHNYSIHGLFDITSRVHILDVTIIFPTSSHGPTDHYRRQRHVGRDYLIREPADIDPLKPL